VAEGVADLGEERAGHVGHHLAGRSTADSDDVIHPPYEPVVHSVVKDCRFKAS